MKLKFFSILSLVGLVLLQPSLTQAQPEASTPANIDVANPDESIGSLILVDESATQVIALLEEMTGKIILRRQDLPVTKINFNSRGTLTKGEAVLALESLLSLNNIMLTEMGGKFMKAVPASEVNRHVPEMLMGSTLDLQPSQQIFAKLFKLEYLQVEATSGAIINPLLSQSSAVVVFPKANAILITDALLNLQRIETLINQLDKPDEIREDIQFIKLNFVQASEMQDRLDNLIQGPLKAYLEGSTSITADERTNQLILITHPGNLPVIQQVIDKIDIDAAPLTSSEVFPLRQAKAEEVVTIIENIIDGQKEGREEDAKVTRENESGAAPAAPTPPNGPQNIQAPQPAVTASSNNGTSNTNSALQFSNFVGLSADERTNSIVAFGTASDLKTLRELIEQIDIPLPQVRIEAIITEVSLADNQSSGITSLGFTLSESGELTFAPDTDIGNISDSRGIFGSGFSVFTNDAGLFEAVLSAADSDSDVRVLSTPTIVVSHNEEGIVNVSESRPIITSSTSSIDSNGTTNSSVEFRDIGIQLTVTPLIGADGSVQMAIEQTFDSIVGNTTIDGNEQPIIGRREATSTITVGSGEVIILGGLQENERSKDNAYFPVLGRLPLLKNVFGGSSNDFNRQELIIFIRPTVFNTPESIEEMTHQQLQSIDSGDHVIDYLDTGKLDQVYMEGSNIEKILKKSQKQQAKKAKKEANGKAEEDSK